MKKIFATLLTLSMSFALNSQALTIDLSPSAQELQLGDNLTLDVKVSDLADATAPSLGVYDLNLMFDATRVSISTIIWGDAVKGNQLDLNGFGSMQMSDASNSGILNLLELSFDDAWSLDNLQAGNFSLFSVIFSTIAAGPAEFTLGVNALGDANGDSLLADSIGTSKVMINTVAVPEPAASFLFLIGLIALGFARIKRQH
ncbi:MAG TPA: cohesin domain-containing protein [Cellvibrio sp.]|nr:cohesin domain-containing protein [Cellvibrio sp.]